MKVFTRISVALLLLLLTFGVVSAHARLVKSNPAASTILGTAPTQVTMTFDEQVEPNFSEVQVVDAKKQRVDTGELQLAPGDPYTVVVPLKPTGDGTYNVIWKILSATDGHITRGVFAYGVGNTAGVVLAPTDPSLAATPNDLTPFSAAVRWMSLYALLGLVGGFVFRFYLLEPSLDFVQAGKNTKKIARTRWTQLMIIAFVFYFISNIGELLFQAQSVSDAVTFTSVAGILQDSRFGQLWILRNGMMTASAIVLWLETRRGFIPQMDISLIVLGNLALFTRSLNSHSASGGNFTLPVFADWLHLLGVALWVGGLFSFAWLMPFIWHVLDAKTRGAWIARLIAQFSLMALGATVVIAITGVYSATQQIPALDLLTTRVLPTYAQLTESIYTDALLAKVLVFVVMIGFGALNLLFLSPRFRKFITEPEQNSKLFTRFRLTVGAEVLLGLTAIFLAGVLTLSSPPRSNQRAPGNTGGVAQVESPAAPVLLVGYPASDVLVELSIGPTPEAPTVFNARVSDKNGNALTDIQRVIFSFTYLEKDTGAQNVNADAAADNQYKVEGNFLSLEGMWKIQVTVRRKGLDDQKTEFPYFIEPASAASTTPAPDAQALLVQAQKKMNSLTALKSQQDLNDGVNGVVTSLYDYQAPDKTNFSIVGQGQSTAIGSDQYYQNKDGTWTLKARVENFVFPSFNFADTAQNTHLGRADKIGDVPAQIVMFDTANTSGTELIHYAYWLADDDKRVLQFGMDTASHYMIQTYADFDGKDINITAPANVLPAPTLAPVTDTGPGPLTTAVQGTGRARGPITGDLEGDGALVMVVSGVVVLLVGSGGRRTRNGRLTILAIGAASVILGIGLFVDAVNGTAAAVANIPVNTARASTGQQIYEQNCLACHGAKGYGDGPGAAALPVKPFDLTTHVLLHDEQYLYATILDGRGYMPAFGNRLSQDQILDVIAYTRLLAKNAQQGSAGATPRPGFTPQP